MVFFNEYPDPGRDPGFAVWLSEMTHGHEIRKVETFTVKPVDGWCEESSEAFYLVYDFVPKVPGPAVAEATARANGER